MKPAVTGQLLQIGGAILVVEEHIASPVTPLRYVVRDPAKTVRAIRGMDEDYGIRTEKGSVPFFPPWPMPCTGRSMC